MSYDFSSIQKILENDSEKLLDFNDPKIKKERLHVPGPNHIDNVFNLSNRSDKVKENLKKLRDHGRLSGTGYYSILPVDQGVEHSAGASFAKNPDYFDPENIIKLAIEAGCNGVASTYGILAMMSKKYADKIPFIVKLNHNEILRYPNTYDQIMFTSPKEAHNMGALGVGATIYFGSEESKRQIQEVSKAFAEAHEMGMFTILWCYLRNNAFKADDEHNYHTSADLTGQANYLGVTIGADIIKQKLPELNGGYEYMNKTEKYGKYDEKMYTDLASDHPIDLCRYQIANCYMGRIGLINSGGSSGGNDLHDAIYTATVNKRAGGSGLILGRKAFQRPMEEGVEIINAVQDVYLCKEIEIV